jgi:hypothetical protein
MATCILQRGDVYVVGTDGANPVAGLVQSSNSSRDLVTKELIERLHSEQQT